MPAWTMVMRRVVDRRRNGIDEFGFRCFQFPVFRTFEFRYSARGARTGRDDQSSKAKKNPLIPNEKRPAARAARLSH